MSNFDAVKHNNPLLPSAANQFLLDRIDYERVPPMGSTASGTTANPFKLDRMAALLERLGNPQLQVPCVHIAGSKGKGSTAAMIAAVTQAAGLRTGLFTSPHLHHFEERIQIDRSPISPIDFESLVAEMRPVAESMDVEPGGGPTFFELVTALAWMYFGKQKVDLVVLEVGLGGRLDATNLCRPLVTVITSISRDHTRLLGETLPLIAREKGGIIKSGVPLVTGVQDPESQAVLRQLCEERGAERYALGNESDDLIRLTSRTGARAVSRAANRGPLRCEIDVSTPWRRHVCVPVPLAGEHQGRNAALALAAIDCLNATRPTSELPEISELHIAEGFRNFHWPLRIETVHQAPLVILDAAHNPASIAALIEAVRPIPARRRVAIFGASRDKEADTMLRLMADYFDELILSPFLGNPRSYSADKLKTLAERVLADRDSVPQWQVAPTPAAALEIAVGLCHREDLLCITGSIFLAAESQVLFASSPFGDTKDAEDDASSFGKTC